MRQVLQMLQVLQVLQVLQLLQVRHAVLLQVLHAVHRSGQTLAGLLEGVTLFPQTLLNVRLPAGLDWRQSAALQAETGAVEAELASNGRVLIRPSGTEPVLRVMVEARDAVLARRCAERLSAAVLA